MNRLSMRIVAAAVLLVAVAGFMLAYGQSNTPTVPPEWESLDADGLVALAQQLSQSGEAGQADRQLLVTYLGSKFLATEADVRSFGLGRLDTAVAALIEDMSSETRATWYNRARDAFAGSNASLSALNSDDFPALEAVLSHLGKEPLGLFTQWINATTDWQSLTPEALACLTRSVRRGGTAEHHAQVTLRDHIQSQYMGTVEAVRSVECRSWHAFASHLVAGRDPAVKDLWARKLEEGYFDMPETAAPLTPAEIDDLKHALVALGRRHVNPRLQREDRFTEGLQGLTMKTY